MINNIKLGPNHPFPKDDVSPKVKEKSEYGLAIARAIWSNNETNSSAVFFSNRAEHEKYINYALGQQTTDYKPLVGINPRDRERSFVPAMNLSIRNYATKRVNIVVERLTNTKYDPVATAIDPLAIDRREDWKANMKVLMDHQKWLAEISQIVGQDLIGTDQLPLSKQELELEANRNYKDKASKELEKGIQMHLSRNKAEDIRELYNRDNAIVNGSVLWVGMDENGRPTAERVDPGYAILPYSPDGYYNKLPYGAHIKYVTAGELRKMAGNVPKDLLEKAIETGTTEYAYPYSDPEYIDRRDVKRIPVMYFEYKTTNVMTHMEYTDGFGNPRFIEKEYEYYTGSRGQDKFKEKYGDERKLYKTPYTAVYSGKWVVGTDLVFGYGLKHNTIYSNDTGTLGEPILGYIVSAPGMMNGKTTGIVKQMIPVLDDLQYFNLKLNHLLSKQFPNGAAIDLYALRKAAFESGGKKLSEFDIINMAFQNGIILFSSEAGGFKQGSNYQPVTELKNGVKIAEVLQIIQHKLIELDEIIGVNEMSGGSPLQGDRKAVRVAQMQMAATDTALGYLYRADKRIYAAMCRSLGMLHVQSLKYDRQMYEKVFGEGHMALFDQFDIVNHDYGIDVDVRPSQDQWQVLEEQLIAMQQSDSIRPEDVLAVRRVNNIKEAEDMLKVFASRYRKEKQENELGLVRENAKQQQESNIIAAQKAMELEQKKFELESFKFEKELTLENIKAKNQERLLKMQIALEGAMESRHIKEEGEVDLKIAKARPKPTVKK